MRSLTRWWRHRRGLTGLRGGNRLVSLALAPLEPVARAVAFLGTLIVSVFNPTDFYRRVPEILPPAGSSGRPDRAGLDSPATPLTYFLGWLVVASIFLLRRDHGLQPLVWTSVLGYALAAGVIVAKAALILLGTVAGIVVAVPLGLVSTGGMLLALGGWKVATSIPGLGRFKHWFTLDVSLPGALLQNRARFWRGFDVWSGLPVRLVYYGLNLLLLLPLTLVLLVTEQALIVFWWKAMATTPSLATVAGFTLGLLATVTLLFVLGYHWLARPFLCCLVSSSRLAPPTRVFPELVFFSRTPSWRIHPPGLHFRRVQFSWQKDLSEMEWRLAGKRMPFGPEVGDRITISATELPKGWACEFCDGTTIRAAVHNLAELFFLEVEFEVALGDDPAGCQSSGGQQEAYLSVAYSSAKTAAAASASTPSTAATPEAKKSASPTIKSAG